MYTIWFMNEGYIQGRKVGSALELAEAIRQGKQMLRDDGIVSPQHDRSGRHTWLDSKDGTPLGVIVRESD